MLYPTAGAEGAAKSILRRVANCVSGCVAAEGFKMEDPKSKPEGIPLASLSRREARGALGSRDECGIGRWAPRLDILDV